MTLPLLFSVLACRHEPAQVPTPSPAAQVAGERGPAGDWEGKLKLPNAELRVVLHLAGQGDGLTATLDSPDQGAFGLAAERVTVEGRQVVVEIPSISGRIEATWTEDDRLNGSFAQGRGVLPLVLTRTTEAPTAPKRPQEPVGPVAYAVEEVTVPSVEGVVLAGTYTRPEGPGPFPAVVLITGSGPQDRDESLLGHRPFLVVADHLTRAGVAVLRLDDRGVGGSTGDFAAATTPDFVLDAGHALAWLDAREDTGPVGLVGHSEGGLVAPLLAPEAAFLVLLAAPGVPGAAILEEQGALLAAAEGAAPEEVAAGRALTRALTSAVVAGADREGLLAAAKGTEAGAELSADELDAVVDQVNNAWFRWFLSHDPVPALRAVQVPVLALFGSLDLQVPPEQSAGPMREALGARGTVEVLPGLNHLFQPATTGAVSEYARIETTFEPAALARISTWILER